MIHEAYMPVYMGSRFLARDGTGRTEVVQEALADLKRVKSTHRSIQIFQSSEKGQSTREIASCKTKYNESRLVKRSSHPIQN